MKTLTLLTLLALLLLYLRRREEPRLPNVWSDDADWLWEGPWA